MCIEQQPEVATMVQIVQTAHKKTQQTRSLRCTCDLILHDYTLVISFSKQELYLLLARVEGLTGIILSVEIAPLLAAGIWELHF